MKIILKRRVAEILVNNYNTEWLEAWNGNMDIQACLDFFAVSTYITDYYTKDESGTTALLREASKQHQNSIKDKMKCLAQCYLTHREVGESEAIYRIVPSLHLSESNIKCIFVATGFPNERNRFLRKVEENQKGKFFTVEDYAGQYELATSIHEKYESRPKYLEKMCLAQFATVYDTLSQKEAAKLKFNNDFYTSLSDRKIVSWNETLEIYLPFHIKLSTKSPCYMKLRSYPSVLRIHKHKFSIAPHDFFYSELLLYMP